MAEIRKTLILDVPDLSDKIIQAHLFAGDKTACARPAITLMESKGKRITFVMEK